MDDPNIQRSWKKKQPEYRLPVLSEPKKAHEKEFTCLQIDVGA